MGASTASRRRRRGDVLGLVLALVVTPAAIRADGVTADGGPIQHVVIIMQENRSFDSYFGTYPGAGRDS